MIKVPMEMPMDCLHCPFFIDEREFPAGDSLYMKIARCQFAPVNVGDPWRNVRRMYGHREEWCPLKEVEG